MIDLIDWNRAPLTGHALVREGAAHTSEGDLIRPSDYWLSTGGQGHGKCECGAISTKSGGRKYRREWHRQHKAEIRNQKKES